MRDYGFIPAALPDSRCFGDSAASSVSMPTLASSNSQQVPARFVSRISEMSQAASQASPFMSRSNLIASSPSSVLSPTEEEEQATSPSPSLRESAVQSTAAAKKGAGDLFTTLRATYNSVAETISELDFSPLGRQAVFVRYASSCKACAGSHCIPSKAPALSGTALKGSTHSIKGAPAAQA